MCINRQGHFQRKQCQTLTNGISWNSKVSTQQRKIIKETVYRKGENLSILDIWSGVISRIYKEMTTLNNKKSNNAINKWAKMNRHFLKVEQNQIHDFQLKLISKKCKSKLHYDSSSLLSDWESRKILSSHLECLEMIIKCSKQATMTVTWPFTRGGTGQLINLPF